MLQIEEIGIETLPKISQEYEIHEMTIGIGSKSCINLGFMNKNDEIIPIIIKTSDLLGNTRNEITNKVIQLKTIENVSIIKYYDGNIQNDKLKLYLEYINRGDLELYLLENHIKLDKIKSSDLSKRQIIDIFLRISKAIKFLHSKNNISHRDIKPLNVLMDFKNIVLIDFETCKITNSNDTTRTRYGTAHYMAPEIISSTIEYNPKLADIYSLGITLYNMFFPGCFPETKSIDEDFFQKKHIRNISSEIMDLIRNMIKIEPEKRLTLEEIIYTCENFLEQQKNIISMAYPIQKEPKCILHKEFKLKGKVKDIKIIMELLRKEKTTYFESLIYQRFFFEISFGRFIFQQVKNLIFLKDIFYSNHNKILWKKGVFYLLCRGYIHLFYYFQIFSKKDKNSNKFFNENKIVLKNLNEDGKKEYKLIMDIFKKDIKLIGTKITKCERKIKCLNLVDITNPNFLLEFQDIMIKIINFLLKITNEKEKIRNFIKFVSDILFYTIDFSKRTDIFNIEKYVEDVVKSEKDFDLYKILKI